MALYYHNSSYFDESQCFNRSYIAPVQYGDVQRTNGGGPSIRMKLVFMVVVMAVMGSILYIDGFLRLFFPRLTLRGLRVLGRYNLDPVWRFALHFAFIQSLPLLSAEFSSAEKQDYGGSSSDALLLILLWMLLVELIRKKVQAMMLPADGSSFARGIGRFSLMDYSDEAGRLVVIGFFLYTTLPVIQEHHHHLIGVFVTLWALGLLKLVQRAVNTWMASGSWHTARNPLLIAGYMQHLMETTEEEETADGAVDMSKCRFAVMGEEKLVEDNKEERQMRGWSALKVATTGGYGYGRPGAVPAAAAAYCYDHTEQKQVHVLLNLDKMKTVEQQGSLVTVGKIWELHAKNLSLFPAKTWQHLEDLCLALSLFKLLRRRFEHYPMVEVGSPWARRFMLQGLLNLKGSSSSNHDKDQRPFHVLEQELEILCNYYQQAAAPVVMSQHILFFCNSASSALFLLLCIAAFCAILLPDPITLLRCAPYELGSSVMDLQYIHVAITLLLLLTVNALETYEFWTLYIFSSWNIVRMLCSYSGIGSLLRRRLYSWVIAVRFCAHSAAPWFTRTGINLQQVSVIDAWGSLDKFSARATHRQLPKAARSCIVQSLKGIDPGTGIVSLPPLRGLHYDAGTTSTEIVLACHLATELLELTEHRHLTPDELRHRAVASALSKYCMYLVAHVPQLLPDDEVWVSDRYEDVRACLVLVSRRYCGLFCAPSAECRKENAVRVLKEEEEELQEPTTRRGLRLFRELERRAVGAAAVWEELAGFWVRLLIYLAPSNDVQGHARALATWGSDLITCLWAFCTHAGITRQPLQLDCQDVVVV